MKVNDIISLFKGIGIIIDENINNESSHDDILKIYKYFYRKQIPVLTYMSIPEDTVVQNFQDASFIVLDWNLHHQNPIPLNFIEENIHFIELVNSVCFVPIFIFTNEEPHDIALILQDRGLFYDDKPNNIFIKRKSEINSGRILFSEIAKWIRRTPSVYVMKQWDCITHKATTDLFHELHKISPNWTSIMMKTFKEDVGMENAEIGHLLFNNLETTCAPLILDNTIVHKTRDKVDKIELRRLLERERYIVNDKLMDYPALGDIFIVGKKYFFNFRPDCDLVRKKDPTLYLIEGSEISEADVNRPNTNYKFDKGEFVNKVYFSIVPFVNNGKIVVFDFKKISSKKWKSIRANRIGRLLPPYSIRLKTQLLTYLQRQAIPSIPREAIK